MLWTPNPKTVDPIPLCQRCGGLRRDWHQANRARLGVGWLHGVCCCEEEVACSADDHADSVDITLSGVDAAMCTGCIQSAFHTPGAQSSLRAGEFQTLTVDGTYSVGYSGGVTLSGNNACYFAVHDETGAYGSIRNRQNACHSGLGVYSYLRATYEVYIYQSDGSIGRVEFLVSYHLNPSIYPKDFWAFDSGILSVGAYGLGDSIPNGLTCSTSYNGAAADGGTAVVTL